MFRLGSLLFIPAYLSVTLYHPLAGSGDSGGIILMAGELKCYTYSQWKWSLHLIVLQHWLQARKFVIHFYLVDDSLTI